MYGGIKAAGKIRVMAMNFICAVAIEGPRDACYLKSEIISSCR
jgi:hypothetical protein